MGAITTACKVLRPPCAPQSWPHWPLQSLRQASPGELAPWLCTCHPLSAGLPPSPFILHSNAIFSQLSPTLPFPFFCFNIYLNCTLVVESKLQNNTQNVKLYTIERHTTPKQKTSPCVHFGGTVFAQEELLTAVPAAMSARGEGSLSTVRSIRDKVQCCLCESEKNFQMALSWFPEEI